MLYKIIFPNFRLLCYDDHLHSLTVAVLLHYSPQGSQHEMKRIVYSSRPGASLFVTHFVARLNSEQGLNPAHSLLEIPQGWH